MQLEKYLTKMHTGARSRGTGAGAGAGASAQSVLQMSNRKIFRKYEISVAIVAVERRTRVLYLINSVAELQWGAEDSVANNWKLQQ